MLFTAVIDDVHFIRVYVQALWKSRHSGIVNKLVNFFLPNSTFRGYCEKYGAHNKSL